MQTKINSGKITDVPGIRVGHHSRVGDGYLSGVTVVLPPPGTIGGVDVRGGGPGTHETDALAPGTLVPTVDAVTLTGGSAYGLVTAHGVQRWCEEQGRGLPVGPDGIVPIVPAAAVFDLGRGGRFSARPEAEWGYRAAAAAGAGEERAEVERGTVGAGTGALAAGQRLKGGVGTASVQVMLGEHSCQVGAIAVVNARGVPQLPGAEELINDRRNTPAGTGLNTTIAVVATDARLDVADITRTAACGHDGLARALRPVHTLSDGDTIFGLATAAVDLPTDPMQRIGALVEIQAAAADAVEAAVLDGIRSATSVSTPAGDYRSLADLLAR